MGPGSECDGPAPLGPPVSGPVTPEGTWSGLAAPCVPSSLLDPSVGRVSGLSTLGAAGGLVFALLLDPVVQAAVPELLTVPPIHRVVTLGNQWPALHHQSFVFSRMSNEQNKTLE